MLDLSDVAFKTGNAPQALADVSRDWLVKLRKERGLLDAVRLAGPFIMSSQGKQWGLLGESGHKEFLSAASVGRSLNSRREIRSGVHEFAQVPSARSCVTQKQLGLDADF